MTTPHSEAFATQLRKVGVISAKLPAQSCLDIFSAIEARNERIRLPRTIATLALLAAAASVFGAIATGYSILVAAAAILGLTAIVVFAVNRRWTTPAMVSSFAIPALRIFKDDTTPSTEIDFALDLRGPTHPAKKVSTAPVPELLNRPGVTRASETIYTDPIVTLSGKLTDGSAIRATVTDHARVRRIGKRNRRGKYKSKSKTKARRVIRVRVRRNPATEFVPAATTPGPPPLAVAIRLGDDPDRPAATASLTRTILAPGPRSAEEISTFTTLVAAAFAATQRS